MSVKNKKLHTETFIINRDKIPIKQYFDSLGNKKFKYDKTSEDNIILQKSFNTLWRQLLLEKLKNPESTKAIYNIQTINSGDLIDLTSFVNGKDINIPQSAFTVIKAQNNAVESILHILKDFKEPLLPVISENELRKDYMSLKEHEYDPKKFVSNNKGRFKFLNSIMYNVMIRAKKYNSLSYYEGWNDPDYKKKMVQKLLEKDIRMNNNSLYNSHGFLDGAIYNFPPNIAKQLYNRFNAIRVLDFCAGYGGRLTGFWTSNAKEYVGIDPNKEIPYDKLLSKLKQYDDQDKKVTIIDKPAEDVDYETLGSFDFIFTSPPYFNLEIYSDDNSQSYNRYPEFNDWLEKFLFKTLEKVVSVLQSRGILAINIKDHPKHEIVEPMIKYLTDDLCMNEMKHLTLIQSKRYKNAKYESIYLFMK